MLFYGPPGTGKTSTILALARQLFGCALFRRIISHDLIYFPVFSPDNFRNRVLELNASDERGISIVREKIKNFARQTPRAQVQTVASDGKTYPCPPFKIIILDEADSMTQDAQGALRRIMEVYARITRFCLVCNYVTRYALLLLRTIELTVLCRIIEPLASRCSKFRFTPLDQTSSSSRLSYIATAEHIDVNAPVLDTLISTSSGDLRRAITYLQSASRLSSSTNPPTPITVTDIQEIAGVVPDAVIKDFARVLGIESSSDIEGDSKPLGKSGFDPIRNRVRQLIRDGYSASQILLQVRVFHTSKDRLPTY